MAPSHSNTPKKTAAKDIRTGISVDQIAAQHIRSDTKFASLEMGCEEGVQGGNCDNGYNCAYTNSLSWRSFLAPMPPEVRPLAVFSVCLAAMISGRIPRSAPGK